jgi:uncharacterized membrane protein YvlD (DUF360 family)
MKKIIRFFFYNLFTLYLVSNLVEGMRFEGGQVTFVYAAGALALAMLLVKPVINLFLLPINLITFGTFRWISFTITLYLVTLLVTDFKIYKFAFTGFNSPWFELPAFVVTGFMALIAYSFLIAIVNTFIVWLQK